MAEYAPDAIRSLFNAITVGSKVLSGIIGDRAHTYGYHRGRNFVTKPDYSAKLADDLAGDGEAAAALDINLSASDMQTVTNRLLAAARAGDPRLRALREFCGTTNGSVTHGFDLAERREHQGEWDDSHLWHVHLSIYRRFVNDAAALAPIADVINGKPLGLSPNGAGETRLDPTPTASTPLEDEVFAVSISTHPTTKKVRGWIIGPKGIAEVSPNEAGATASVLGLTPTRVSEVAIVQAMSSINKVV